jgi:hypothetical protein
MIRAIQNGILICLILWLAGCPAPEEKDLWDEIKISDLTPEYNNSNPQVKHLQTINFDIHIYEVPTDNFRKLDDIRRELDTRPLRYNSRLAFSANSFSAYFGQFQAWNTTVDLLTVAGGERRSRLSLLLPDGQVKDVTIAGFDHPLTIFFTSSNGLKEGARVGPGILAMRIKAGNAPASTKISNITIYPVFLVPVGSAVPELDARMKLREFPFTTAAFGLNMSPGDFIFLAPEEYKDDPSSLGSLFFNNPKGSLFFNENKHNPPELKPALRVYMLTCTAINN